MKYNHSSSTFAAFACVSIFIYFWITYFETPGRALCDQHISVIVVGAGVMGLSLALALANKTSSCIYVVDSSPKLFAGASGRATGCLHYGDVPQEVQDLSYFSWHKHQELNEKYDGRYRYGFSPLQAYTITGGGPRAANDGPGVKLPLWLKDREQYNARLEPYNTAAGALYVLIARQSNTETDN
jgi:glycine/D-amino acid oxidase-like deaminating enzyme